MNRRTTEAIVLRRVEYQEYDRIITLLTEEFGKLPALAKGVRKPKSKLAGGIELLAINEVTILKGKTDLYSVVSSKMKQHFKVILSDYDRLNAVYQFLKYIQASTVEHESAGEYYALTKSYLQAMDGFAHWQVAHGWGLMQLAVVGGFAPNLLRDSSGRELSENERYAFDPQDGSLSVSQNGNFNAETIKSWRVLSTGDIRSVQSVRGIAPFVEDSISELEAFIQYHI